jgi:hypothetical protein
MLRFLYDWVIKSFVFLWLYVVGCLWKFRRENIVFIDKDRVQYKDNIIICLCDGISKSELRKIIDPEQDKFDIKIFKNYNYIGNESLYYIKKNKEIGNAVDDLIIKISEFDLPI